MLEGAQTQSHGGREARGDSRSPGKSSPAARRRRRRRWGAGPTRALRAVLAAAPSLAVREPGLPPIIPWPSLRAVSGGMGR